MPKARPPLRHAGAKTGPGGTTRAFWARKYFAGAVNPDTSLIDGDEGRDNNFGSQFLQITGNLASGPDWLEKQLNALPESRENLIVVIDGLDDGSEDGEIKIGLLANAQVPIPTPHLDGTDHIPIDARMVLPGTTQPRFQFSGGYMTDNTVVSGDFGAAPQGALYLPIAGGVLTPLDLRAVTFTFELDPTHHKVRSSTFAAVFSIADMVNITYDLLSINGGVPCGEMGKAQLFTLLNPAADLTADLPGFLDPTGTKDCDAISWGWRIEWTEIAVPTLDDIVMAPPVEDKCAGQGAP